MIKKLTALFLCFVFCFILSACSNKSDVPDGMLEVSSEFIDFRFFVPHDWTPDISTGFVSAKYSDNSNVSVQALSATIYEAGDNYAISSGKVIYSGIDDYFNRSYFPSLQSTLKETTLEESVTQNISFGGNNRACRYVYTIVSDGITYRIMQIFTPTNSAVYVFTYTATADNYAKHLDDITKIADSFIFN